LQAWTTRILPCVNGRCPWEVATVEVGQHPAVQEPGRFPPPLPSHDYTPTSSSRFVTKVRGNAFPLKVSLVDLVDEFYNDY
jgi:hypothetical protein